ncbi:unnamed protein product [Arabidopsis halleri]
MRQKKRVTCGIYYQVDKTKFLIVKKRCITQFLPHLFNLVRI